MCMHILYRLYFLIVGVATSNLHVYVVVIIVEYAMLYEGVLVVGVVEFIVTVHVLETILDKKWQI